MDGRGVGRQPAFSPEQSLPPGLRRPTLTAPSELTLFRARVVFCRVEHPTSTTREDDLALLLHSALQLYASPIFGRGSLRGSFQ